MLTSSTPSSEDTVSKDYGDIAMGGSQDDPSLGASQGENPKPTRAPLEARSSAPAAYATSGIERAMHAQANREHPVTKRSTPGKNGTY
jgi:hypothetical protein